MIVTIGFLKNRKVWERYLNEYVTSSLHEDMNSLPSSHKLAFEEDHLVKLGIIITEDAKDNTSHVNSLLSEYDRIHHKNNLE